MVSVKIDYLFVLEDRFLY